MESLENSLLFSVLIWLIKDIYLDIEHCLSRIDKFLHTVPEFLSIKWDSQLGDKTKVPDSFLQPSLRGPILLDGFSVLGKLYRSEIDLITSSLGVGCALEDADHNEVDELLGEDDFLALFDEEEPSLEEIKATFDVFDSNKDGYIDCVELRRVLCDLGFREGCELEDCKRMIRDFDVNGDGLIDFREFVMFMEKCFLHT